MRQRAHGCAGVWLDPEISILGVTAGDAAMLEME
jgi:hypothetical protein